jgi:hypothetical protein
MLQLAAATIPDPVWYAPTPHRVHALLPVVAALYVPGRHSVQFDSTGMPSPVWYFPAPHGVHLAAVCIPYPVW